MEKFLDSFARSVELTEIFRRIAVSAGLSSEGSDGSMLVPCS
jgi:hypothetical protein